MKKLLVGTSILIALMIVNSCDENIPQPDNNHTATLKTDTTFYYPMSVVGVTAKDIPLLQDRYFGVLEGDSIPIAKVNDTLLVALLNDASPGAKVLTVNIEGLSFNLPFTVGSLPTITDPVTYINNIVTDIQDLNTQANMLADSLVHYGLLDQNIIDQRNQVFQDSLNAFLSSLTQKSSDDLSYAAKFLASNRGALDELQVSLSDFLDDLLINGIGKNGSTCAGDYWNRAQCKWTKFKRSARIYLIKVAPLTLAGSTFGGGTAWLGGFVGFLWARPQVTAMVDILGALLNMTFYHVKVNVGINKNSLVFSNNVSKSIDISLDVRNIQSNDENSSLGFISSLIYWMNKFKSVYYYLELDERLGDCCAFLQERLKTINPPSESFLRLEVLNNSNVSGVLLGTVTENSSNLSLKFSTNETEEQEFDFKIVYTREGRSVETIKSASLRVTAGCNGATSFTDTRDGQIYDLVEIGNQCWMKQNLNYQISNSRCYANSSVNCDTYGMLYSWQLAMSACPQGWHVPSDAEWSELVNFLGGFNDAGGKLRDDVSWDGNNSSGWSGLPGGGRYSGGTFLHLGSLGNWWSSSDFGSTAGHIKLDDGTDVVTLDSRDKTYLYSCRCIMD